jgi:hypothetical protein
MSEDALRKRARITAWNDLDQVGRLTAEDGEELKVGRTACSDFAPKVGDVCWVMAAKPDRLGPLRRATLVNRSGQTEQSREERAAQARSELEAQRSEPIVPVFAVPLVEAFALAEQRLARPLTEQEVTTLRDEAPCIMLGMSAAAALAATRDDLDPQHAWRDWQSRRSTTRR